jgi:hypothetical protein
MKRKWLKRALVLMVCIAFSCRWAISSHNRHAGVFTDGDFAQLYFDARCAIDHLDAYDGQSPLRELEADGLKFGTPSTPDVQAQRAAVALADYPPTTMFVLAPFTLLRYESADAAWFWLTSALLVLAALSMLDLAEDAPLVAGCMAGFVLLNSVMVLLVRNPAGVVAPFCVIAAWCLIRRRFGPVAVVLMSLSLLIKPQDAGFIWLYFLLAGGTMRRRAWQMLALTVVLGVCAVVWIEPASPHWMPEMHKNIETLAARGGISDPGPAGRPFAGFDPIISVQTTAAILRDDPRFYDSMSYVIGGGLIMAWGVAVLRKRATREGALLALAAASILTILPVYHRTNDAKLLLLMIPACAMLWAGGGVRRWVALALTSAAIFVTSDMPVIGSIVAMEMLRPTAATPGGKLLLLALHPQPLALLAAGCFYLWAFIHFEQGADARLPVDAGEARVAVAGQ